MKEETRNRDEKEAGLSNTSRSGLPETFGAGEFDRNKKPTVLLYADLYEFEGEIPDHYKQEWESKISVDSITKLLSDMDERVELVTTPEELLETLQVYARLDRKERPVLFHLMEGFRSRNRESLIPAAAELFGFPHTGSDGYAQSVSLDKNLTRIFADSIGLPVAPGFLVRSKNTMTENLQNVSVADRNSPMKKQDLVFLKEDSFLKTRRVFSRENAVLPNGVSFPAFVKPAGEGSSLGIGERNIVHDLSELRAFLSANPEEFFPYLVETYLRGTEYTISVMGSETLGYRATGAGRLILQEALKVEEVYGEKTKSKDRMPETLVFDCPSRLETFLQEQSLHLCKSLGTSGAARLDWKLDSSGNPFFLEINLTPGLSPFYSSFPICYRQSLGDEKTLFQEILNIARREFETDRFLYSQKKIRRILSRT
ncbi:D-alanine--D-alanine ligase [Leptospira sp. FAT2]|uniref:D-alanine--D-alanine ligase family protein n=1 Tax=Leptospira sanjuanensis TaxID=2879643 RepID=UPI001EE8217B|nr:D-alanine--D-alanine ligase [Leptospira sanjuanensis]MCG6193840.1 D-alanine--D-alanine ligase [Leptospira sanjuanensis]